MKLSDRPLLCERVRLALRYEPDTGVFRWRNDVKAGKNKAFLIKEKHSVAGFCGSHGYWVIGIDGRHIAAHRLAFLYVLGSLPESDVDHINGDRADNRWSNLRPATRAQNMQNLKGAHKDSSLGLVGIFRKRKRFSASIMRCGKKRHLGTFDTPEEAHQAYLRAKRIWHEFGTL